MTQITELTPEQKQRLIEYREEYFRYGTSTEPADRPRAEAAIARAYRRIGREPVPVHWVNSPIEAAQLMDELEGSADDTRRTYWWGQQDLYWIAYYLLCEELGVEYSPEDRDGLDIMHEIGMSAMWWWPKDEYCVVSERPAELHLEQWDEEQFRWRLHNDEGPAIKFRDGWSIYVWHGVRVPQHVIEEPEAITVDEIRNQPNAEIRRAMMWKYGMNRFLEETGAILEQEDGYGWLYRIDTPEGPEKFVKVVNGTPEPDGSYRDYILATNPDVTTAHEAVARSYGRTVDTYAPEERT